MCWSKVYYGRHTNVDEHLGTRRGCSSELGCSALSEQLTHANSASGQSGQDANKLGRCVLRMLKRFHCQLVSRRLATAITCDVKDPGPESGMQLGNLILISRTDPEPRVPMQKHVRLHLSTGCVSQKRQEKYFNACVCPDMGFGRKVGRARRERREGDLK